MAVQRCWRGPESTLGVPWSARKNYDRWRARPDLRILCIPVMLTPISSDCDPLALEVLAHLFQRW